MNWAASGLIASSRFWEPAAWGVVYQAEDPALKRKVALKVMLPSLAASESARKRFVREAQTAAAIEHDHIVHIYQVGEDRGVPFIAMQFLKGEPLDVRLQKAGKVSIAETMRIGRETARGMAAAHEHGLIHRDIKPANLWLESDGDRVKILDFGLARAAADDTQLTQAGAIIGTPAYMAPEQANSQPVDARCDLFSLGCVLYRLCTGEMPFKGKDTISTLMAVATEEPPSPAELNEDFPAGLSDLVMHLLAKRAEDRPASARAVAEALAELEKSPHARSRRTTGKSSVKIPKKPQDEDTEPRGKLRKTKKKPNRKALPPWLGWAVAGSLLVIVGIVIVVFVFRGSTVKGPTGPGQASIDGSKPGDKNAAKVVDPPGKPPIKKPPLPPDAKEVKVIPGDDRSVAFWALDHGCYIMIKTPDDNLLNFTKRNEPADLWDKEWHKPFTLYLITIFDGSQVTDGNMQKLSGLKTLESLNIFRSHLTDACLIHLKGLTGLKTLTIKDAPFGDAGLALLPELPNLGGLTLERTQVTGPGLKSLKKCPRLGSVTLDKSPVTDAGLAELADMSLSTINVPGTKITDAGLAHLKKSPKLVALRLSDTEVTDAGLVHLRGLNIQFLDLSKTRITDEGLVELTSLHLLHLNLAGTAITSRGLENLRRLRLKTIELSNTKITDDGLAHLKFSKLTTLDLTDTAITDAGLFHLGGQEFLQFLNLAGTKISDDGLKHLKGLKKIHNLDLTNTNITDAALPHLRELKSLFRLVLVRALVSPDAIQELKKALPKCAIDG